MTQTDRFVTEQLSQTQELLETLAKIPAPSLHEEQRARFCCEWLHAHGVKEAYMDNVNNVICPFGNIDEELVVIMAHSDVVFPDETPLPMRREGNRLCCPGVGDDTANVAVLMMTAVFLCSQHKTVKQGGILLVINAAEEGLGNLKGSKAIADTFGFRIKECISFDCHADELINGAVGSRRYRVEVTTCGGHSYFDFGRDNAIAVLSQLINKLYALPVPEGTHTTFNVGTVSGGTSVNTIAQSAQMLFEFRSDHREALEHMHDALMKEAKLLENGETALCVTVIGERPCAGDVDQHAQAALTERASRIIGTHFGKPPVVKDGSTDCNTFLSRGIPSICFGCVLGDGMHTREEYILLDSLEAGLKTAIDTAEYYMR